MGFSESIRALMPILNKIPMIRMPKQDSQDRGFRSLNPAQGPIPQNQSMTGHTACRTIPKPNLAATYPKQPEATSSVTACLGDAAGVCPRADLVMVGGGGGGGFGV